MAKPKGVNDPIDDFDLDFNPATAAAKLPSDITGGISQLSDFMEIPCSKIVEYQAKKESDFKPWPEERFNLLVASIRKNGVIEPVTVRPLPGSNGIFEMLAGEHRWKASMAAGKTSVPAHVMRFCSDESAADIFSITNVLRRENSLIDKVNGWWHYTQASRYKRGEAIEQMISEGILSQDIVDEAKAGMRQVYRYARMHNLIEELLDLADQKHLSVVAGEQLSYLTEEQQQDLLPYKHSLNDKTKAELLHKLADGSLEEKTWCKEEIEAILFPTDKPQVISLKQVSTQVSGIIRDRLPKSAYGQAAEIIGEALDAYLAAHPEYKKPEKKS